MSTKTFEERLEHSKKILNQLIDPSITLEESLTLYAQGIKEINLAQKMIEEAKVDIITIEKNIHNKSE